MGLRPDVQIVHRHPSVRTVEDPEPRAADWADLEAMLLGGTATTWLSVGSPEGVHVRPLFAAWTGSSFVFASNPGAVKSRLLDAEGRCTLALAFDDAHVSVEGDVVRLTSGSDLARASEALEAVYDWPTTVTGDLLDAPYAAPTSGGPPFRAYEVTPTRAWAFPTADQFEGTRFTFA